MAGYIYCLYNEMFNYYGENVYKLGKTIDINNRMCGYTTTYIKPCEIKYISKILRNSDLGENLLFIFLKTYRITENREFFICELNKIILLIDKVTDIINNYTDDEIYNMYLNVQYDDTYKLQILKADDISENDFILISEKVDDLTETEKLSFYKYKFKKFWKFENINEKKIIDYYGNEMILIRLLHLYNKPIIENYCQYYDLIEKTKVIYNIILTLGFDLNDLTKKISKNDYYINVNKLFSDDENFIKDYRQIRNLFNKDKRQLKNIKGPALSKLINGFLNNFGIYIKTIKKSIRINNKVMSELYYNLNIIDKYKSYLV